jgi:hypothetical protein
MLITNLIQIKVTKNYLNYYKQLFPQVNNGDFIEIPAEKLNPKSYKKVVL